MKYISEDSNSVSIRVVPSISSVTLATRQIIVSSVEADGVQHLPQHQDGAGSAGGRRCHGSVASISSQLSSFREEGESVYAVGHL